MHVALAQHRSTVRISVADQGPGITGIDPPRIFDRFARAGEALESGAGAHSGFGIGLSLVRDAVERAGGTVAVAKTSESGTEIELLIPAAKVP